MSKVIRALLPVAVTSLFVASCGGGRDAQEPAAQTEAAGPPARVAEQQGAPASRLPMSFRANPAPPSHHAVTYGTTANYYVDEINGDDSTGNGSSSSPWQSLQKINSQVFAGGTNIYLACGSVWHDVLAPQTPSGSGTLTFGAYGSCATQAPPTIDGAYAIPPQAWKPAGGSTYQVDLTAAPLIVNGNFATDITGWTAINGATLSRGTTICNGNGSCLQIAGGSTAGSAQSTPFEWNTQATAFAVSFTAATTASTTLSAAIVRASTGAVITACASSVTGGWTQYNCGGPLSPGQHSYSNAALRFTVNAGGVARVYNVHVDAAFPIPHDMTLASGPLYLAYDGGTMPPHSAAPYASLPSQSAASASAFTITTTKAVPAGQTLTGASIVIRTYDYQIETGQIQNWSSVGGTTYSISLTTPLSTTPKAGQFYYLSNLPWFLDSASEWYADSGTSHATVWMPNGTAPTENVLAPNLASCAHLNASQIQLDGLTLQHCGHAVDIDGASNIGVYNGVMQDTAAYPLATLTDANNGAGSAIYIHGGISNVSIASNIIARSGRDGINGHLATANGPLVVQNNAFQDIGVQFSGADDSQNLLTLPLQSQAAIWAPPIASISNNTITDVAKIGIWTMEQTSATKQSTVAQNYVTGWAGLLDDIGGIYTSHANNFSKIQNNILANPRRTYSEASPYLSIGAQGIYLDESASNVTVSSNTVQGADYGIKVHISSANTISGNVLYDNRTAAVIMDASGGTGDSSVASNAFSSNELASPTTSSLGFVETFPDANSGTSPVHGSYAGNQYYDRLNNMVAQAVTRPSAGAVQYLQYSMLNWLDTSGVSSAASGYATYTKGSNTPISVANNSLTAFGGASANGSVTCPGASCSSLNFTVSGSAGGVQTGTFQIAAAGTYRLSFDVNASAPAIPGSSPPSVMLYANPSTPATTASMIINDSGPYAGVWHRQHFILTIKPGLSGNAHLAFGNLPAGENISISSVDLVQVTTTDKAQLLTNNTASTKTFNCTDLTWGTCTGAYLLSSGAAVSTLGHVDVAPYSSEIVYLVDLTLVDGDGDGVWGNGDHEDLEASSPRQEVNSSGQVMPVP